MIRAAVATVLLAGGTAFIVIASIGVARMPDVFQRMHAATKAGGIGSSLVVLGVLVTGVARPMTGVLTILFMLLSLSVASQLLARAAYISGAPIEGLERGDPLAGVLDRTDIQAAERDGAPEESGVPAAAPAAPDRASDLVSSMRRIGPSE
ncbi:MAG TPA: monovalent cation/H(+) antiporter subunit G [Gemmatimonadaceae bacterium]|nr:monovalent cation/H(+) antiporter subunit G [Gemmatimonadaceae bacterium]